MKRRVAILASLLMTAVAGFTGNLFGDANGDGRVDMADVVAVVNAAMGHAPDNFDEAMADINGNGKIDEEDASLLAESLFNPPFDRTKSYIDDYERAFTQGYLPMKYSARYRKRQITSLEFKTLLKTVMEKYSPDKMDFFNTNITDYDTLITRGIATIMAYYTAQCIGVNTKNREELVQSAREFPEDMWDYWIHVGEYEQALPHATDVELTEVVDGQTITSDTWLMAWGWNDEHLSYYSSEEIVARDEEAVSYHWEEPFIWEDAVRAITRLYDSFEPKIVYASIDDPRVTTPNASIITPELIAKAAEKEIHNIDDLPWLIGFQMGEGNMGLQHEWRFGTTGKDIREWASWGFNGLKYGSSWRYFFDNDMKANLNLFESLDEMIAAAIESGFHLSLTMCAMPGFGQYLAENIRDNYLLDNDILNPEKRKKTCDIWKTIATRYKDVPNANLSFSVETFTDGLVNPDGWGEGQAFTIEEVFDYADMMIDAIREVSPERFIFFDASYNPTGVFESLAMEEYNHLTGKYKNLCYDLNWMDMAYMFYPYNDGDGNIDYASHSVWVPTYPTTLYRGNGSIYDDNKLTIDGCLPQGTSIDFYIADADNATMNIAADGKTLYEEALNGDFNMGYAMAFGEPFKKSDKKVTVTLEADTKVVTLSAIDGLLNWCGIEVKLPEAYTIKRWWKPSAWDVELGWISEEEASRGFTQKATSSVLIGSTYNNWTGIETGYHITINDDVTFTSDFIYSSSNKELTEQQVKEFCDKLSKWSCHFEDILVTDRVGAERYWNETLEIFKRYKVNAWISAIGLLSEEQLAPYRICDYEGENFEGHHNFNVKLLKILQKYMDK